MGRDIFWQKWAVGVEMKKSLIWRCSESHAHTTFAVVSLLRFRCVCVCGFFFLPSQHWYLTGVFIKVALSVSGPEPNLPVPPPDHETGDVWADADLARPLWKNMFWFFLASFFFFNTGICKLVKTTSAARPQVIIRRQQERVISSGFTNRQRNGCTLPYFLFFSFFNQIRTITRRADFNYLLLCFRQAY